MKRVLFLLISILLVNTCTNAQIVMNSQLEKDIFSARVKLVDEFMRRFNCDKVLPGLDTSKSNYKKLNILSLFDAEIFGSETDSLFKSAQDFAADVLKSNIRINYSDTNWIAFAPCHGKLKGKPIDFFISLTVEKRGKDMYKWVISKVQGTAIALKPSNSGDLIMIMPDDHETNFMSLSRITSNNLDYILNYKQKDYELDQTAAFYTLVNTGQLSVEYVRDLQFMFFQIPGWTFTIKEFDRQTKNSGWLITSFSKMEDEDKETYLKNIYNRRCDK